MLNKEIIIGPENTRLVDSYQKDGVSTPLINRRSILTSDFINKISDRISHGDILPPNCRFIKHINSKSSVLVVEDKPKIRSVKFRYDFEREYKLMKITGQQDLNAERFLENQESPFRLNLSFPYIVYIIVITERENEFHVHRFNVFFRKHPLGRINDYLNIANLLNLSDTNTLCFGRHGEYDKRQTSTISDLVTHLTSDFWNRPFTDEYQSRHYKYQQHQMLHSFLVWAHYSEIDPMFVYSTNWVMHDNNLQEEIDSISSFQRISTSTTFNELFVNSVEDEGNFDENDNRIYKYNNVVVKDHILNVGDELRFNDQNMYVYDLIGDRNNATSAILIDSDDNKISVCLSDFEDDFSLQIENQLNNYVDEIKFGDKIVKAGGIVKIIPNNTYENVKKIRITRDKRCEFVLGKRFYIATEDVFEVIDYIEVDGIKLNNGETYLICNNQFQTLFRATLMSTENNNHGVLYFNFEDIDTGEEKGVSVDSLEGSETSIYEIDDDRIVSPLTFIYLNRLYTNDDGKYIIIKGKGLYSRSQSFPSNYDKDIMLNDILSSDKQSLSINGIDLDISFNLQDEVILGDWENTDLMFNIRKIVEFNCEDDKLNFILADPEGNQMSVEYIDLDTGKIRVGYIRKVKSEYDGIPVGTIAKSIVSGNLNFPKRTNSKISSFIVDGQSPMVLFNNGLTIWFDELRDKFDLIIPETPEYRRIRSTRTFNPDKIVWQSGDLCTKDDSLYLLNDGNEYIGLIYMAIDPEFVRTGSLRSRAEVSREINSDFNRYGILTPRYRKTESSVIYETIPDFHNGFTVVNYDGYYPYVMKNQEVE